MHALDLKGLPVIAADEGEQLGKITRVFLDPDARAITGFAFDAPHGLLQPEWSPRVDMAQVQSLGPDAVLVSSRDDVRAARTDERFPALIEIDDLLGRTALSLAGKSLGKVTGIMFDNQSFAVTEIEVAPGRFAGRVTQRIEEVVDFGRDYLMIANVSGHRDVEHVTGQELALDSPDRSAIRRDGIAHALDA